MQGFFWGYAMIDTVAIYTKEYLHKGDYPDGFKILQQISINTGTIEGFKIVFNSDRLYLTEKDKTLYIHFSLPKLYGLKHNFYALGKDSFKASEDTLHSFLKSFGYEIDLRSFEVGRLDIFKNIMLNYDFITYLPVFAKLNFKRTHKREYVDGFLYANKQRELCFYNKTEELLRNQGFVIDGVEPNRVMRGELRLLNHKEVMKYELNSFVSIPDRWEDIKEMYKEQLQGVFDANLKTDNELVDAKIMILQEKGIEKAIKIFGLLGLSDIPREALRTLLINQLPRRTAYAYLQRVEQVKNLYGSLQNSKELFYEIKEKFLS